MLMIKRRWMHSCIFWFLIFQSILLHAGESLTIEKEYSRNDEPIKTYSCFIDGEEREVYSESECDGVLLKCKGIECFAKHKGVNRKIILPPDDPATASVDLPGSGPFNEPVLLDPHCAWLEQHDLGGCPIQPSGGGGGGGGSGGGGSHYGDLIVRCVLYDKWPVLRLVELSLYANIDVRGSIFVVLAKKCDD